ncbi:MAG: histidine phosphatase family protein [Actinomycetota bacterium]
MDVMNKAGRLLYLLRHAKSDWGEPATPDIDRPLAPRGRKAARSMGRHLKKSSIRPELILCSPARRTRQTLDLIGRAFEIMPTVRLEPWLYAASLNSLMVNIGELAPETASVMLIGHNPGLEELAATLAGTGADLDRLRDKFPTGALATLSVPSWRDLGQGSAELVSFVVPRDLS